MDSHVPQIIETRRYELFLIEAEDLITLFESPEDLSIYESKPYTNPHRVLVDEQGPLAWRVPQVKVDPTLNIWFVRWIVDKASREVVGSISFHGKPDEAGMIEIGLGIAPAFHNQGIGTEAIAGMWDWVVEQPGVSTLRYTVSPDNAASLAVIAKFGFTNVGIQIDEEDGPEVIFELSADDYRVQRRKMNI